MVLTIRTKGNTDIIDITEPVAEIVKTSKIKDGIVNIFVKGSTAGITTIEPDENLYDDMKSFLDEIIPMDRNWKHHKTWGDDNGGSHLRASIVGPSQTIPFLNNNLILGTWQKIVLIDFDTSSREREVYITIK